MPFSRYKIFRISNVGVVVFIGYFGDISHPVLNYVMPVLMFEHFFLEGRDHAKINGHPWAGMIGFFYFYSYLLIKNINPGTAFRQTFLMPSLKGFFARSAGAKRYFIRSAEKQRFQKSFSVCHGEYSYEASILPVSLKLV